MTQDIDPAEFAEYKRRVERLKAYQREWRQKNREKVKGYNRKYYQRKKAEKK
jgi:hypothetical protein